MIFLKQFIDNKVSDKTHTYGSIHEHSGHAVITEFFYNQVKCNYGDYRR